MQRLGCNPGTRAQKPFKETWGTFDRCPIAILRDASTAEVSAINWAIRMAVVKRQGSLAAYVAPGTLSARGESLIEIAEDTIDEREAEGWDRLKESK